MDRRYIKRIERYWSKIENEVDVVFSNIDVDDWFDLWHTHIDRSGRGNSRLENRKRVNELTYEFLRKAEELTQHRNNDIQCWAIVCSDTMDNSVYIHTKNPNESEFPFAYEDIEWDSNNKELELIVDKSLFQIGEYTGEHEIFFFIRKRG